MRYLAILVMMCGVMMCGLAHAQQKKKPAPAPVEDRTVQVDAQGKKSKTYSFTGLDIDGKLKTPQLLYFLNRMKSEFDTTTPDKRSFIPELKRSTDDM
jgi:hypothetical protein